jgi:uncharacterized protein (TIGR02117 family)
VKLFLLLLCFLLAACKADAVIRDPTGSPAGTPIYVANHGWHTGIIAESEAVLNAIPALKQSFQSARFIEFGWGDQDFYQASDISYGLAIKALLFPTDAVLHVAGIPKPPNVYFGSSEVEEIRISQAGFNKMLAFIRQSFRRDSQGNFIRLGRGLYADSFFFRAHGAYHAFYTCNSWIMEALSEAGLPESDLPTLTAEGVMDQVKRYRHSVRQAFTELPPDKKR